MKLFFVAGENSGDNLAAGLIRELKTLKKESDVEVECLGVGGPLMKAAGMKILLPLDQISVIGIWEVIPKIPRLFKLFKAIAEEIIKQSPDAVITVDFPDFNFLLAKSLRKRGYKGKIIHYVAPSVWAWRKGRAKKLASFLDGLICLYPMEPEYFSPFDLKAAFVGHPIVETKVDNAEGLVFREANEIPQDKKTLGLFFGSRESEFNNISQNIKIAAAMVNDGLGDVRFIVPTLPATEYNIQVLLRDFDLPFRISSNQAFKWESFKACDVALAVSGTVALELAYAGVPHVVVYRTNPLTYLILRFMVKIKHVHLANILLDEAVVPEFIQSKCKPEEIAQTILDLFTKEELRNAQLEKFKQFRELIGASEQKKPSRKAAEFVLSIIEQRARKVSKQEKDNAQTPDKTQADFQTENKQEAG